MIFKQAFTQPKIIVLITFLGCAFFVLLTFIFKGLFSLNGSNYYDTVIVNGRVIDPEKKINTILNVGVHRGLIQTMTTNAINGKKVIDASGLIVAPGFINLHVHTMDNETFKLLAQDGVSSALELEGGHYNIDEFYQTRANKSYLNYGTSVGHMPTRMHLYEDPGNMIASGPAATKKATKQELLFILKEIEKGLSRGALGIGFALAYTPGASEYEILEAFRLSARYQAPAFVHTRFSGSNSLRGLMEVIAYSSITRSPLHIHHITSTGGKYSLGLLKIIEEVNAKSQLNITTEVYPYTKGMTSIQANFFKQEHFLNKKIFKYKEFLYVRTGELLNETNFDKYQKQGGWVVFGNIPKQVVDKAILHPLVMIASDTILVNGKGHPRNVGSFSKILRYYVREKNC